MYFSDVVGGSIYFAVERAGGLGTFRPLERGQPPRLLNSAAGGKEGEGVGGTVTEDNSGILRSLSLVSPMLCGPYVPLLFSRAPVKDVKITSLTYQSGLDFFFQEEVILEVKYFMTK